MGIVEDIMGLVPGADAPIHAGKAVGSLLLLRHGAFDVLLVSTAVAAEVVIRETGFVAFRARWAYYRQLMSLQGRLLIEQILWGMGKPWSLLISGFKPVEAGTISKGLPPTGDPDPSRRETNVLEEFLADNPMLAAYMVQGTEPGGAHTGSRIAKK